MHAISHHGKAIAGVAGFESNLLTLWSAHQAAPDVHPHPSPAACQKLLLLALAKHDWPEAALFALKFAPSNPIAGQAACDVSLKQAWQHQQDQQAREQPQLQDPVLCSPDQVSYQQEGLAVQPQASNSVSGNTGGVEGPASSTCTVEGIVLWLQAHVSSQSDMTIAAARCCETWNTALDHIVWVSNKAACLERYDMQHAQRIVIRQSAMPVVQAIQPSFAKDLLLYPDDQTCVWACRAV